MLGFGIMMWFCSLIMIILSILLLRGNYAGIHGKVFDNTEDKEGYAKALGKPVLLMGIGLGVTGIVAIVIQKVYYSILLSVIFLLMVVIVGVWFGKIQKRF